MFMVVSYDVVDDKRRLKVMNALLDYGTRVQYSVFECDLTGAQTEKLRARLLQIIAPRQDDVRFYFLCDTCVGKMRRLGRRREPRDEGPVRQV